MITYLELKKYFPLSLREIIHDGINMAGIYFEALTLQRKWQSSTEGKQLPKGNTGHQGRARPHSRLLTLLVE